MSPAPSNPFDDLSTSLRSSWHAFADVYEPMRPELYRYCRYLTRSAWDAEDLAQDALTRAFVLLGQMGAPPDNPRAWLFRVASNAWIDQVRRRHEPPSLPHEPSSAADPQETREAASTLLGSLAAQERAAVVLKDVLDFRLEEIAEVLSTTVGAVKSALSRGRTKLQAEDTPLAPVAPGLVDDFCVAFNARDLDRLTALLLDGASVEVVGTYTEYGPEAARRGVLYGMLFGSERIAAADVRGGIEARYIRGALPSPPRAEVRAYRGEPILLSWYAHVDGEAVRALTRFETSDGRISRLRNYFFTSDSIAEVCRELDVPYRVNGYRYWLTGC